MALFGSSKSNRPFTESWDSWLESSLETLNAMRRPKRFSQRAWSKAAPDFYDEFWQKIGAERWLKRPDEGHARVAKII